MRCCRQRHPALLGATMRHQAAPALAASSILQRARSTGNSCRNFNASKGGTRARAALAGLAGLSDPGGKGRIALALAQGALSVGNSANSVGKLRQRICHAQPPLMPGLRQTGLG